MAGVAYCNMCKCKMNDHDDEALERCLKVAKLVYWVKEED